MSIHFIAPDTLSPPRGHYTAAVKHNGVIYVSGQLPFDKDGHIQLGTIEEQTALCMYHIEQILLEAQSNLNLILKINIFVSDIALWPRINIEYAKIMGDHKPARIVVPCSPLHHGCQIEIDCIAAIQPM